jgi:Undecaprenyl-phosphate glucose phosphotransferase
MAEPKHKRAAVGGIRVNSKLRTQVTFVATLALTDLVMAGSAFVAAYWLRQLVSWPEAARDLGQLADYTGILLMHVVSIVAVFAFSGLYRIARMPSRVDEFYSILVSTVVGTLVGVALTSLMFKNSPIDFDYSRGVVLYAWVLTVVLVTAGRLLHGQARARLRRQGWGREQVVIVGATDVGRMIFQKIQSNPGLGYEVVGFVTTNGDHQGPLGAPVLGNAAELSRVIDENDVNEVIIALPEATHQEILMLISECERGKVAIKVFPDVFQYMASQLSINELGGLPLLAVRGIALRGWRRAVKRVVDVVGAVVGLVFLSPLMVLMALMIKLESKGSAFYAQERMGLDARPFKMLKFRSMRQDAEKHGPGWTVEGDPRVTRLGGVIRRINVDELPQLVNVLLGEMSLVGPRPERPIYVNQFKRSIPRYMDRHWEKAGMTGWAQVNGLRGDTSISERTKYDLWYIENWSLLLDIKILIRTFFNMMRSPNAY